VIKTRKSANCLLLLTFMITACSTNSPTLNLPEKSGSVSVAGSQTAFKVKAVGEGTTENTVTNQIIYSGIWSQTADAGASGGSVHTTGGNVTDNGDPNNPANPIKYTGNKWTLPSDPAASVGTFASNSGIDNQIEQNNTLIKYTTSPSILKWFTGTPATYNYNDGKPRQFTPSTVQITSDPYTTTSGTTFTGSGWILQPITTSYAFSYQYASGYDWGLEYTFQGSNTTLKAFKGKDRGRVFVSVLDQNDDYERAVLVDLYSPITSVENVLKISGLKMGNHKIVIEPAGKNSLATSNRFDFVMGSTYGSAEYEFKGDRVGYIAYKDNKGGRVDVSLDANDVSNPLLPLTYSLYNSTAGSTVTPIKLYNGLDKSLHRLSIESTGTKDGPSAANNVYLDSLEVNPAIKGTFSGAAVGFLFKTDSTSTIADLYIDGVLNKTVDLYSVNSGFKTVTVTGIASGSHTFEIIGNYQANPSSSGHSLGFDGLLTAIASLDFAGTGIEYIATKGPDQGKAEVIIDGVSEGIIDLYSSTTENQAVVFSKAGLIYANHTINIVPIGNRNALSSSNAVNIDAFNVEVQDDCNQPGFICTLAGVTTSSYLGAFGGDNEPAVSAKLFSPMGLAMDDSNNLYIADSNNNRIRKVNLTTKIITTIAGNGGSGLGAETGPALNTEMVPTGVTYHNGNLYVADSGNSRVRKIDLSTGNISTVAGSGPAGYGSQGFGGDNGPATEAKLAVPWGIAFDSAENMYIGDTINNRVRKVDTNGTITTIAGSGPTNYNQPVNFPGDNGAATNAVLSFPRGIAFNSVGDLYIADGDRRIRKINMGTGIITTIAGSAASGHAPLGATGDDGPATSALLSNVEFLFIDAQDNIYLNVDSGVRKIDANSGIITKVAGLPNAQYTSGYEGDGGPATLAKFSYPFGITMDSTGNLYISDQGNNKVRVVYH
jgi:hypothetical protein